MNRFLSSRIYRLTGVIVMIIVLASSCPVSLGAAESQSVLLSTVSAASPSPDPTSTMPSPTPEPKIVYGELANRLATGHGESSASIVFPDRDSAISLPATKLIVNTQEGALLSVLLNGEKVSDSRIGSITTDTERHTAVYTFYGLALTPGPNTILVTPNNLDGNGKTVVFHVFGPGPAVSFEERLIGPLKADGKTTATLEIQGLDIYRHHALPGANVKVTISSGDARLIAPGDIIPLKSVDVTTIAGGMAMLSLIPGLTPGQVVVHIFGNGLETDVAYNSQPDVRRAFVTGLITGGLGSVPGSLADQDGSPNGANSRKGRIALYGSGAIGKKGLATIAYDTADRLQKSNGTGSFAENPTNRPYDTYGDSSTVHDDALSRNRLYARYDQGQSHFLIGEFQAQTSSSNSIGGFSQLVSGAQAQIANKDRSLTLFAAKNDIAYARTVIPAAGFSSVTQPLHPDIVVGSEQISLASIDRRTGIVISETALVRGIDYELDYVSGNIRFINIPLPLDASFNPQQLIVRYEYGGTNVIARTYGGRLDLALGKGPGGMKFGSGYVNDVSGQGDYNLFAQDVSSQGKNLSFSFSHASSHGKIGFTDTTSASTLNGMIPSDGIGQAWSGKLSLTGLNDKLEGSFQTTTANYLNPFGGLSTPGLFDYRASYTKNLGGGGTAILAYDTQRNNYQGNLGSQSRASIRIRKNLSKKLTIFGGAVESRSTISSNSGPGSSLTVTSAASSTNTLSSTQGEVGFDWRATRNVGLMFSRLQNLSTGSISSSPNQTQAQIGYDFGGKGRVYLRENITDTPVQTFGSSSNGLANPVLGSTSSTTFGFERSLGAATSVNEELEIDHTLDGDTIRALTGVREKFRIGKTMKGDFAFQRVTGNPQASFQTYSSSLDWHPTNKFKASTSLQSRTGQGNGSTLFLGVAGAINDDISIFGSVNKSLSSVITSSDSRVGISIRPSYSDHLVTLIGFRSASGISALGGHSDVFSIEQIDRLSNRLEFVGRYAYKLDGDSFYAARTSVGGLRLTQSLGKKFDVGFEISAIGSKTAPSSDKFGLAIESGMNITPTLRLAGGYNFTRVADPTLIGSPAKKGLYFTMSSAIDRIFGWGSH